MHQHGKNRSRARSSAPATHQPRLHRRISLLLLQVFLAAFFTSTAWAQLYTGSLTGVVTDPSGSVVPGATTTLTDVTKGFNYNAATDSTDATCCASFHRPTMS